MSNSVNPFRDFYIGSTVAAGEVVTAGQILNYFKNCVQDRAKPSKNPLDWYRGMTNHMGAMVTITGIQMAVKSFASGHFGNMSSAVVAGAAAAPVANEIEKYLYLKGNKFSWMEMRPYMFSTIGLKALPIVMIRDVKFVAAYSVVGPKVSKLLQHQFRFSESRADVMSSIGVGGVVSTITHPLDTVKTELYKGMSDQNKPQMISQVVKKIWNTNGYRGFWAGGLFRSTRVMYFLYFYNQVKKLMTKEPT